MLNPIDLVLLLLYSAIIYYAFRLIQRRRFIRWLGAHGTRVAATVMEVHRKIECEKSTLNEKMWSPVLYTSIKAQWRHPRTLRVYTFTETLRGPLPGSYGTGHHIEVLIDFQDPARYAMLV